MSKLLKVTLEYDDKIMVCEGEHAKTWASQQYELALQACLHGIVLGYVEWIKTSKKEYIAEFSPATLVREDSVPLPTRGDGGY